MPGPKAIRTKYGDHLFRSRLEARWAVFFDALGIRFEYEAEGYELSDGTCHLPDFWLPTFEGGIYAEVKPTAAEFGKAVQFSREVGKPIWLCDDTPRIRAWNVFSPAADGLPERLWTGVPNADQAEGQDRMYAAPGYDPALPEHRAKLGFTFVEAVRFATGYSFWEPRGRSSPRPVAQCLAPLGPPPPPPIVVPEGIGERFNRDLPLAERWKWFVTEVSYASPALGTCLQQATVSRFEAAGLSITFPAGTRYPEILEILERKRPFLKRMLDSIRVAPNLEIRTTVAE